MCLNVFNRQAFDELVLVVLQRSAVVKYSKNVEKDAETRFWFQRMEMKSLPAAAAFVSTFRLHHLRRIYFFVSNLAFPCSQFDIFMPIISVLAAKKFPRNRGVSRTV